MTEPIRAAVLGAGAWGSTFAAILADAGADVVVWSRYEDVAQEINSAHTNTGSVPHLVLPPSVSATTEPESALYRAEIVAIAVPSQAARKALEPLASVFPSDAVAVSLMKGIEQTSDALMSEVVGQALDLPDDRVAVVSGPNLAFEIAAKQPTATVVASANMRLADGVAAAIQTSYFKPFTNADLIGVELCGAMKNVIALGSGVAQGVGYGLNTVASIITRGLLEMTRLGLALGARQETFAGLAGMGDLVATCASPLSRNNSLGQRLGRGMTLEEAKAETGGTAEGVWTSSAVLDLANSLGIDAPVTEGVVGVLAGGAPGTVMDKLLSSNSRPFPTGPLDFTPLVDPEYFDAEYY